MKPKDQVTDLNLFFEWLDEWRSSHGKRLDDLVIKHGLDIIHTGQDGYARVTILSETECHRLPILHHTVHCLLQRVLLGGGSTE